MMQWEVLPGNWTPSRESIYRMTVCAFTSNTLDRKAQTHAHILDM